MDDVLSREDIIQQYVDNIVLFRNRFVYVYSVLENGNLKLFDIKDQKFLIATFSFDDFKAPSCRLGMVNIHDGVVYLTRIPVRRYGIGISSKNIKIHTFPLDYSLGSDVAIREVKRLRGPSVSNILYGVYPTFKACLVQLKTEEKEAVAFDRQFAIIRNGNVLYKQSTVGKVKLDATSIQDIEFSSEFKHLSILLEGNHERTISFNLS